MVEASLQANLVVGFNTRAIRVSDKLVNLLTSSFTKKDSYLSVSVDSYDNSSYADVHGVSTQSGLYDRVCKNLSRIKFNLRKKIKCYSL